LEEGTYQEDEVSKTSHQQQLDQMEKLHSELNKMRKENN
jgi:hypothetical protein